MDIKSAIGLGAGAVLGIGGGIALTRWIEQTPEEIAETKALTQQELLDKNERSTKILGGLMVGLPVAAGVGFLGTKGFELLAARSTGLPSALARGGATTMAVVGGVAALGALPLWGGWGFVGLVAAGNERDAIERGENPYVSE